MDQDTQEVFDALKRETTHLHYLWKIYRQLFGTDPTRIQLMNQCASAAFRSFHDSLLDAVILTLCKLNDPPQTMGKDNLSVRQLTSRFDPSSDAALLARLEPAIADFQKVADDLKELRNKRISHFDLETAKDLPNNALSGPSREKIERGMQSLREFLNVVDGAFFDAETRYDLIFLQPGTDGDALIECLNDAVAYDQSADKGIVERK